MAFNLFGRAPKTPAPTAPTPPSTDTAAPAKATTAPAPKSPASQSGSTRTSIQDIIAPSAIEVDFSHLKIDDVYLRTLFVTGYPRYVSANWLAPLVNFNHSLDISMYVYPSDSKDTLDQLRRRIAEMEAEINTDIERGRIPQAATEAGLEDAKSLQDQLVKGAERFFQFSHF